jgi:hypothetical protein
MRNIIIIILCILLLYYLLRNSNCEGFGNTGKLSFVQEMELTKLLRIMRENFDDNKIEYFITGKTLLAATNNKKLIPEDNGAFVLVLGRENEKNIQNIDWKKYGCILDRNWISHHNHRLHFEKKSGENFPFVEIFVMIKNDDNEYINESGGKLLEKELYPVKKYQIGDLLLNGPNEINTCIRIHNWDMHIPGKNT